MRLETDCHLVATLVDALLDLGCCLAPVSLCLMGQNSDPTFDSPSCSKHPNRQKMFASRSGGFCKHKTSNTAKILRKMTTMKTMATVNSDENEMNENYSIRSKTGTTRTPTSRPQSKTPMTTLTSTDPWRTCTESARTAHFLYSCDCLTLHILWLKF